MTDSGGGGTRGLRRALVLAVAVALAAGVATTGIGPVSADTTTETTSIEASNPIKFVYVDGGTANLAFVREDGSQVETNVSAETVGPMTDLDSDGLLEAPYVTDQGKLRTIDVNGEGRAIDGGVPYTGAKIGVGDWTGDGVPEVVYPDTNGNVYYANASGTPTRVGIEAASAVLGVADFDGTGGKDIVFVGTSQNLHYYNGTTSIDTQYGNVSNSGATGAPADFYQNGTLWVPAIDGSSYPEIANSSGNVVQFRQTSNNTDKTSVAGVDWAGDGDLEIVHLQGSEVAYTKIDGTTSKITDASGATMTASKNAGVAGVESYPTNLSVSEFEANATAGQNVTVNVTTNHDLSELNVTLDGPESATLLLDEFEQAGTNPYSYTATYNGSTDGKYEATVERAASAGDSVSSAGSDTASVDEVAPVLHSVNLTDATDDDGLVASGDTIEVTANATGDVGTMTANLSAFDAGSNVSLSHENGDTYNWTGVVGENATDGDHAANVTVGDGQGNTTSTETGTLSVDTSEPSVELRDNRTVAAGEQAEFSPRSVENANGDVTYEWEFGDGANASNRTVNHTYDAPGGYVVNLTVSDNTGESANASMNVTVKETPAIESVTLTDVADENGIVVPGDIVEVRATVSGDATSVTANLSAFGASSSVELTSASGDTYNETILVDSNATDSEQSVAVTVTGSNSTDSAETGALTVDTDTLDVSLNDSRTVDVGEEVEYSPAAVNDTVGDVTYEWEFGSSTAKSGKTVTYAFDSAATYEVVLTASDGSNDTASASMKIEVASNGSVANTTSDDSSNGGDSGSESSGGGTDLARETTTDRTTDESTQTPTEEIATTSQTVDQTAAGGESRDDPGNPGPGQTPGEAPGFGAVAALLALAAAAGLSLRA
ncbi:PKD domain-containing protein [Halobacterium noricense]|uniref:PKD domain-containing protein n=1 Tax=Halobacterium noricense TaxID=223182 RepID=UPI001E3738BA|nr:PKD domain-containing protein [Halobacterium noricense]UHH25320.1 PKD domain-containing protein [Halobacterium noricense]